VFRISVVLEQYKLTPSVMPYAIEYEFSPRDRKDAEKGSKKPVYGTEKGEQDDDKPAAFTDKDW
jgi:hypothetical protein